MNFVKKIVSSIRDLFSKKAESASQKNIAVASEESETSNESKFLTLLKQVSVFIYAYLKRLSNICPWSHQYNDAADDQDLKKTSDCILGCSHFACITSVCASLC